MRTARAGVLFPRPSGLAERQTTHPSTSGLAGCKRTVHEGARDSPSLVCRGRHPVEHPGCVVWDAAGTHKRPRPRVAFFSRQGEKSERSGITLPDTRGWSTQGDKRGTVTLSLRLGSRPRVTELDTCVARPCARHYVCHRVQSHTEHDCLEQ